MEITFSGEAGETYQKLISFLATFTVQIEELDNPEGSSLGVFDATFIGPDPDSEWVDAVLVRRYNDTDDDTVVGEVESVRAKSIHVY